MIDVKHLTRRFDGTLALDDVSFEVHPGEIVALLGPNGAGKTTASRIIGGILAPSEGDVLVEQAPVSVGREPWITDAGDCRCFFGWRSDPFFFDVPGAMNGLQFTGDDFFADEADLVAGQNRHVAHVATDADLRRNVVTGEHRMHTG